MGRLRGGNLECSPFCGRAVGCVGGEPERSIVRALSMTGEDEVVTRTSLAKNDGSQHRLLYNKRSKSAVTRIVRNCIRPPLASSFASTDRSSKPPPRVKQCVAAKCHALTTRLYGSCLEAFGTARKYSLNNFMTPLNRYRNRDRAADRVKAGEKVCYQTGTELVRQQ